MRDELPDELDGDDLAFYVALAIEANSDDPSRFVMGGLNDLADEFRVPRKRLRHRMRKFEEAGWVEWTPARNSETPGLIRMLMNVEHSIVRPTAGPTLAPSPTLPDRARVTRGNAPHREQRTENREHLTPTPPPSPQNARGEAGLFQPSGGPSPRPFALRWRALVDAGIAKTGRDALEAGQSSGWEKVFKMVESNHGAEAAADAFLDALDLIAEGHIERKALRTATVPHYLSEDEHEFVRGARLSNVWTSLRWDGDCPVVGPPVEPAVVIEGDQLVGNVPFGFDDLHPSAQQPAPHLRHMAELRLDELLRFADSCNDATRRSADAWRQQEAGNWRGAPFDLERLRRLIEHDARQDPGTDQAHTA